MIDRRTFLEHASAAAAAITLPPLIQVQQSNLAPIFAQIGGRQECGRVLV